MNARILSIASVTAALLMGAGVAQANPFEGDQAIAPRTVATSSLGRADVQAQLADAQKNGTMILKGDQLQTNAFEQGSQLSRADVVKAAHDALVAGHLPEGEGALGE
jgi:hypothetical protein